MMGGVHIEVGAKAIHDWMERPLSTSKKLGYKCSILCLKSHDMFRLLSTYMKGYYLEILKL